VAKVNNRIVQAVLKPLPIPERKNAGTIKSESSMSDRLIIARLRREIADDKLSEDRMLIRTCSNKSEPETYSR
jgi:hypothetical protein